MKSGKGIRALTTFDNRRTAINFQIFKGFCRPDPIGMRNLPNTLGIRPKIHLRNGSELTFVLKRLKGFDIWLDTCFCCPYFEEYVKGVLIPQKNRLMITRGIERELRECTSKPLDNPSFKSSVNRLAFDPFLKVAYDYYLSLLKYRKIYGEEVADDFRLKNGRFPERFEFAKIVSPLTGSDGEVIAWDGHVRRNSPNRFNDEELIATALMYSLFAKRNSMVITADEGVVSQFIAMNGQISANWSSLVISQVVSNNREILEHSSINPLEEEFGSPYQSYIYSPTLSFDLRSRREQILNGCWRIVPNGKGGFWIYQVYQTISASSFSVLAMKNKTNGRSTDLFGDCDAISLPSVEGAEVLHVTKPIFDSKVGLTLFDKRTVLQGLVNKANVISAGDELEPRHKDGDTFVETRFDMQFSHQA